jgi:hypothetical protein
MVVGVAGMAAVAGEAPEVPAGGIDTVPEGIVPVVVTV